ncbi:hypothetical protein JB92DRAFT_2827926 [Gautieria morchelliformis]|nr:hypothetical protein JB92DRAFT_2827926 [Gautieria morchelliformis]
MHARQELREMVAELGMSKVCWGAGGKEAHKSNKINEESTPLGKQRSSLDADANRKSSRTQRVSAMQVQAETGNRVMTGVQMRMRVTEMRQVMASASSEDVAKQKIF